MSANDPNATFQLCGIRSHSFVSWYRFKAFGSNSRSRRRCRKKVDEGFGGLWFFGYRADSSRKDGKKLQLRWEWPNEVGSDYR